MQRTTQIGLIHFSDIHFSSDNTKEWEELSSLVLQDLRAAESWFPSDIKIDDLALALSGDFTQRAKTAEFDQAAAFIKSLLDQEIPIKKSKSSHDDDNDHVLTLADVYLVPGNHDVVFTEKEKKARFGPFSTFYNELFDNVENRKLVTAHDPKSFTCVHERDNLILAEVNCCEYVEKDTPEQSRGNIDNESIKKLDTELEALKEANLDKFERSAKVLMLHHHPVLLPSFVEDRGNDSVANGNWLMWIARRYGFQLVLHGHKHIPCTFTYDPSIAFEPEGKPAVLFVAGGSVNGSLPESITSNTYNLILLKWHPEAKQGRVRVITRGLIKKENGRNGTDPLPAHKWKWSTVKVEDRVLSNHLSIPRSLSESQLLSKPTTSENQSRFDEYERLRYYHPVTAIRPSLVAGQAYEAVVWIERHGDVAEDPKTRLEKVVWSAGTKFRRYSCQREQDSRFTASFHYWGSMLVEAELIFADQKRESAFVYCRVPTDMSI